MAKKSNQCYYRGMTPRELATKVLNDNFKDKMSSIPIDPFRLMRKYGVVYQFMEFEDLEGIYIVPEDDNDVALIGINYQRPITRQRFTAAHELCHHLKDRESDIYVAGAEFETEDYRNIPLELQKLQKPVEELSDKSDELSNSEYLLEALKIHHRITQIHPFRDGNGRTSRALLNWMLRYKGLPPIYFKASEKELYYHALQSADSQGECSELLYITIQELFRTMIQLNKR